jgi:hypothetical protein
MLVTLCSLGMLNTNVVRSVSVNAPGAPEAKEQVIDRKASARSELSQ